jgi:hypothetical protein
VSATSGRRVPGWPAAAWALVVAGQTGCGEIERADLVVRPRKDDYASQIQPIFERLGCSAGTLCHSGPQGDLMLVESPGAAALDENYLATKSEDRPRPAHGQPAHRRSAAEEHRARARPTSRSAGSRPRAAPTGRSTPGSPGTGPKISDPRTSPVRSRCPPTRPATTPRCSTSAAFAVDATHGSEVPAGRQHARREGIMRAPAARSRGPRALPAEDDRLVDMPEFEPESERSAEREARLEACAPKRRIARRRPSRGGISRTKKGKRRVQAPNAIRTRRRERKYLSTRALEGGAGDLALDEERRRFCACTCCCRYALQAEAESERPAARHRASSCPPIPCRPTSSWCAL